MLKATLGMTTFVCIFAFCTGGETSERNDPTRPVCMDEDSTPAMKRALNDWIDVDFTNAPIDSVFRDLSRRFGVPIDFDDGTLVAAKIERDHPVTFKAARTKLAVVLEAIVSPHGLTAYDESDRFRIVEKEGHRRMNVVRFHPVADLILLPTGAWVDLGAEQVIQIIEDTVDRDVWEPNGGDATIQYYRTSISIIVNAPKVTHEKVHRLLGLLRKTRERTAQLLERHDLPSLEVALGEAGRVAVPPLGFFAPPSYPPAASVKAAMERFREMDASMQETSSKVYRLEMELEALKKASVPPPTPSPKANPASEMPMKKKAATSSGDPDF